ncbi:MAG: M1 family metallopeptidase [Sediminicola sp.]
MDRFFLPFFLMVSVLLTGQQQHKVDFRDAKVDILVDPIKKQVEGTVVYSIDILKPVDSIFLDAKEMQISGVLLNGKRTAYTVDNDHIIIHHNVRPNRTYSLKLQYTAHPDQALYFLDWELQGGNPQVWTQGQGKYTSHWLPSLDDMNEKLVFDLKIGFAKGYTVVANGKLLATEENEGVVYWSFDMESPMSSYLLAFAAGNYSFQTMESASGISLEQYYYPQDSLMVEPTYRHSQRIFDFLESEIGVPYPWQDYKQIPVKDFLYAGMENTGTTIFSDAYIVDSIAFVDKNYVNVHAHELAHQWFGNLVTETDASNHWLHEGFATYYAYLSEKEIIGFDHFYWNLYGTAKQLHQLSEKGQGESLLDPKASSATFYEKGAWALFVLRDLVGDDAFRSAVQNYLQKFRFKNATVNDFMEEVEKASGKNMAPFREKWLIGTEFPMETAKEILGRQSHSLATFFKFQRELITSNGKIGEIVSKYWKEGLTMEAKREIIHNYGRSLSEDFLKKALQDEDVKVRQAVVQSLEKVTDSLRIPLTELLDDQSYLTQEQVLYKLWVHYPLERHGYLDALDGVDGLPNKNVRLLWLTLALITKDYQEGKKAEHYRELMDYTSPKYPFEVRMLAFQYIGDTVGFSDRALLNLVNACTHHSWQFQKFARSQLDAFMENASNKKRLIRLREELNGPDLRYLNNKLRDE